MTNSKHMPPSVPVSELEKLIELWINPYKSICDYDEGCVDARNKCADELDTLISATTAPEPKP